MAVFHKLYRIAQSSRAHKTESVSVISHARSAAVCSTEWDQKQRVFVSVFHVHLGLILSGHLNVSLLTSSCVKALKAKFREKE